MSEKSEGLKRQIRREEIAMAIANGVHSDEVLGILEAVVEDRYGHVPRPDKGYIILSIQTDDYDLSR